MSVRVSAAPVTGITPWALEAEPRTVTVRSPTLSMASSTAVIETVSAGLAVAPAAMVMVASEPTV